MELLRPTAVRKRVWGPALTKAGLRHVRIYSLRHTFASMLISQGENIKYISTQLVCAQQGVSLAGESPAAPSQGGCVDKRPGGTRRPRGASREEGRVSIVRWNLKGLRRTSGP